ncbi:hypothetical protein [Mesorhizobium sp. M0185]|uniref:hypothetical protein n=1 Tax=unclassified Mesorhizobium TaxID=325217 RepID=UPI003336889D
MIADGEIEQFLGAVLNELQRRHDAQGGKGERLISGEAFEKLHLRLHFHLSRP